MLESPSIVSLKIKNFLSISDVEIHPGQVNQICGNNNQGKTTVIRALEFAIKGAADKTLVQFGKDAAEVIVELADHTLIKRRVTAEGKQTVDVRKYGFKASQAQSFLDALFGEEAFNPLSLLDPKRRNDAILQSIDLKVTPEMLAVEVGVAIDELPPLDYNQHGLKVLEQCHRFFYQRRAEANKVAEEKKKRWETYKADLPPMPEFEPLEIINAQLHGVALEMSALEERHYKIKIEHQREKEARARFDAYCKKADEIDAEIKKLNEQVAILEARSAEAQKYIDAAEKEIPEALEDDSHLVKRAQELKLEEQVLKGKIETNEKAQAVNKQYDLVCGLEKEYAAAKIFAQNLTMRVEELAGPIKQKIMAQTEMPIQGLAYVDGNFLINGITVDNLSASHAMKLSLAVARKLAKRTKLICLDGAEALDKDTYAALRKEMHNDGYTYFLTKVGEPFEATDMRRTDTVITMHEGGMLQ